MKRIYMDHSATTPLAPEVLDGMHKYLTEEFGNASSVHSFGREAKKALDEARERVAKALGATAQEIIFTSGGTEADNLAILGAAQANRKKGSHLITTTVEHHAVLDTFKYLEKNGFEVTYLPVDEHGQVSAQQVKDAIKEDTILVSIMHANNEVGTIMPIAEIGRITKEKGIIFHVDAVQSLGKIPVLVNELNCDLLALSSHKIYGPKGVGALYVRKGTRLAPTSFGGAQERKRRAGTENVAGCVGLGLAIERSVAEQAAEYERLSKLRDKLISGIKDKITHIKLNGHPTDRLPHNVNFSFNFIEGEALLLSLDMVGIAASSGSACSSGSLDPSHVLTSMGLTHEVAHGSLRLTLGKVNTEADVDYVLEHLPKIVERLREMSPLTNREASTEKKGCACSNV